MSDEAYTLNTKNLDKLLKALKAKPPMAKIGIMGDKVARSKSGALSNADIGAKHEMGDPSQGLPQRSFLRIPLIDNLYKYLVASGAFDKKVLARVIKEGTLTPWVKVMAVTGEQIIGDGFMTGGFGKWAPWASKSYENNTGMILVDTTQLRDSITSEVKES